MQQDLCAAPRWGPMRRRYRYIMKRGERTPSESRMWVFAGGPPGVVIILYQYHRTRSGKVPLQYLSGYQGYLQTDDYSGYDALAALRGHHARGCWAHARRKFSDAKKGTGKPGSADVAIGYIARLYAAERELRRNLRREALARRVLPRTPPSGRSGAARASRLVPGEDGEVPPQSLLGKAFFYLHHEWAKLIRYLAPRTSLPITMRSSGRSGPLWWAGRHGFFRLPLRCVRFRCAL